jgi:hypothetical protein
MSATFLFLCGTPTATQSRCVVAEPTRGLGFTLAEAGVAGCSAAAATVAEEEDMEEWGLRKTDSEGGTAGVGARAVRVMCRWAQ